LALDQTSAHPLSNKTYSKNLNKEWNQLFERRVFQEGTCFSMSCTCKLSRMSMQTMSTHLSMSMPPTKFTLFVEKSSSISWRSWNMVRLFCTIEHAFHNHAFAIYMWNHQNQN
jgi:hypothetical protein